MPPPPTARLDEVVGRYVASLLKGAPAALAGTKRAVRDVPKLSMAAAFAEMGERSARSFASEEAREGMAAFAEKRPPRWAAGAGEPPPSSAGRDQVERGRGTAAASASGTPQVPSRTVNTCVPGFRPGRSSVRSNPAARSRS